MNDALNTFTQIFQNETVNTINGLRGSNDAFLNLATPFGQDSIVPSSPYVLLRYVTEGDFEASLGVILESHQARILLEQILKRSVALDDEALLELGHVFDNIFGSVANNLSSQRDLPKLEFISRGVELVEDGDPLSAFSMSFIYECALTDENSPDSKNELILLCGSDFLDDFVLKSEPKGGATEAKIKEPEDFRESIDQDSAKDIKSDNLKMIMDVKLNLKVRIGQKTMLLKDVLAMDIGSVVELNQLAKDPLDVLIDDKVIAQGEVVVVDGNFGVRITKLFSERVKEI